MQLKMEAVTSAALGHTGQMIVQWVTPNLCATATLEASPRMTYPPETLRYAAACLVRTERSNNLQKNLTSKSFRLKNLAKNSQNPLSIKPTFEVVIVKGTKERRV